MSRILLSFVIQNPSTLDSTKENPHIFLNCSLNIRVEAKKWRRFYYITFSQLYKFILRLKNSQKGGKIALYRLYVREEETGYGKDNKTVMAYTFSSRRARIHIALCKFVQNISKNI